MTLHQLDYIQIDQITCDTTYVSSFLLTHWLIQLQSEEMCSTLRVETKIMRGVVPEGMQPSQNL